VKIRSKIILVVLPLIIVTLILAETASYFNAINGVNRVARQFLGFKAVQLENYAANQWELLAENGYAGRPDMQAAVQNAVEIYAKSISLSDTELIFAVNGTGEVVMSSSPLSVEEAERGPLLDRLEGEREGITTVRIGGEDRVIRAFYFSPFQWYIVISELESVFYQDAYRIAWQTLMVLAAAILVPIVLLLLFTARLTGPLGRVVAAMQGIIAGGDLSGRVAVEYRDETGKLAYTFNLMIAALERAYGQIKGHAFQAVLAGKKEQRIRQIFQKYVPRDLIDQFFASPESMLVGENRSLAILFSDIRSFTTISESLAPDEMVQSLNRYFSGQVDIIMNRQGIVDKYMGDAIMAFWGAPVKHEDDAIQAVMAGLDMLDALRAFNEGQKRAGKPEFRIGIGINFGTVTVGNIGSERKMDYTVIGDPVNLASRLEGLTKIYREEILISEAVYGELRRAGLLEASAQGTSLPCRFLDTVAVKGKKRGVKIYTIRRSLSPAETKAWALHNQGMELYYRRAFTEAGMKFQEMLSLLPRDLAATAMLQRCNRYAKTPPAPDWDGIEVMQTK
jgi:class 3 adenylate cyclase/HAMP domain-containing protein